MEKMFAREHNTSWMLDLQQLLSVLWRISVLHNKLKVNTSKSDQLSTEAERHPHGRWNHLLSVLDHMHHTSHKPVLVHYLKCIPLKSHTFESAIKHKFLSGQQHISY